MSKPIRTFKKSVRHLGFLQALKIAVAQVTGKKTITIKVADHHISMRMQSSDLPVVMTSMTGEFDPLAHTLHRDFDGLIVDAGGYIGTAAIALSDMFPKAKIVSIEPSSDNFAFLLKNTATISNIVPIHSALSLTSGDTIALRNRKTGNWGFTIVSSPNDVPDADAVEVVETISLDDIATVHGEGSIGLLKLDIEGAEKELFDTPPAALSEAKVVFVELHDRIVAGCSSSFERFSRDRKVIALSGEKHLSIIR